VAFYQSSIGRKIIVALTGIILITYVIFHLLGNLLIYLGQGVLNAYAKLLFDTGPLLWIVRFIPLAALVTHIVATIQLAQQNRQAKPQKYVVRGYQVSTLASRTMIISGLIVLCFVAYHLLHFTFQVTNPGYRDLRDAVGRHDVYRMEILSFQQPWISFFFATGLFLLTAHLCHGFSSVTQTLGINNRKLSGLISSGGQTLAWLVLAGYMSIPATILLGLVR
jgi:succinate dehydrogenase / fumarate reductase cytochrome b subunit